MRYKIYLCELPLNSGHKIYSFEMRRYAPDLYYSLIVTTEDCYKSPVEALRSEICPERGTLYMITPVSVYSPEYYYAEEVFSWDAFDE